MFPRRLASEHRYHEITANKAINWHNRVVAGQICNFIPRTRFIRSCTQYSPIARIYPRSPFGAVVDVVYFAIVVSSFFPTQRQWHLAGFLLRHNAFLEFALRSYVGLHYSCVHYTAVSTWFEFVYFAAMSFICMCHNWKVTRTRPIEETSSQDATRKELRD